MSGPEETAVLNCVASLCTTYCDGRRLVRDLRRQKQGRRILRDTDDAHLEMLGNTLDKGNTIVRNQYNHSLMQMGPTFARGDQEACNQLKNITMNLQGQVIKSLNHSWQNDDLVDFRVLQDLSNESRDKSVLCLLSLHQRMVLAGLIGGLSPSVLQETKWDASSGYSEMESPQGSPESLHSQANQSNIPPSLSMQRRPTGPSIYPPPTGALPTPPPSADPSRRNTASSEGGKNKTFMSGAVRSPRLASNEPKPITRSPTESTDSSREASYATRPNNPPPPMPVALPPMRPPVLNLPLRPTSAAGSHVTSASNEQFELITNPWDETGSSTGPRAPTKPTPTPSMTSLRTNLPSPNLPAPRPAPSIASGSSSSVYSMQPPSKKQSFSVPGADQREYLPSEKNKFRGLCKSAWRLQTGQQKKAMKARERLVTSYGKQTAPYWACATCDFEGKLIKVGKEERLDAAILEVPVTGPDGNILAIRWRWSFLFRSHFPMKKSGGWDVHTTVQHRASFGCLFCCALGKNMQSFTGIKALVEHLAADHVGQGRWPKDEVLYRMNCIVGERALDTADWDLNLVAAA